MCTLSVALYTNILVNISKIITVIITDETQIVQQSELGNVEATLGQITTDSMIQVQLDENKEAISITIMSIPEVQ